MSLEPVSRYETERGVRLYRMSAQVFPMLVANVYLVIDGDYSALVDTGSGLGQSDEHVRQGLEQIRDENRRAAALSGDDTAMLPRRAADGAGKSKR